MKAVILQPSFIPWRGYFHQIYLADLFIFYDCVQYDKHGWRNRNRIKTPQGTQWLTIPVNASGVYGGLEVRDVSIVQESPWRRKHLKAIELNYRKAPYWSEYQPLIERLYQIKAERLADFTIGTTIEIARALGIEGTRFVRSSELEAKGDRSERLVNILESVGADHYISGPSAKSYIEPERFSQAGIQVEYMRYHYPEYPQLYAPFEGGVSVLDLLFNVGGQAGNYIWAQDAVRG